MKKHLFPILILWFMSLALVACSPAAGNADTAVAASAEVEQEAAAEIAPTAADPRQAAAPQTNNETESRGAAGDEATPAVESEASQPPEETAASCPEATADTQLLKNTRHGYCLLYPAAYKVEKPNEKETILVIGGLLNAGDPRVHIQVEEAGARTTPAMAAQIESDFGAGFDIARSSIHAGGAEAIVLDGLPGQEMNRRVIFTHDGLAYNLMFSPTGHDDSDVSARMETLYETVLDSFTFIAQSDEVTAADECLQATADTQLLLNETDGYCLLYPAGYTVEQPNEEETVFFMGSLLDVAHPKLFVEVQEAGSRTAVEVADEVAAQAAGFEIERTFGVTLGYQPAEVLDKMPGQDMNRQVIVVHDGRLYKLTFVPTDEAMADLYAETEALYDLVIKSFRFLPQP